MVVNDNVYEIYLINGSTRVAQGVSDRLRGVLHRVNCTYGKLRVHERGNTDCQWSRHHKNPTLLISVGRHN